ncbi:MAG TPA: hypothetical protein VMB47_19610 [Candidatus Aquilonibacter sp.]|nr:hypothetical protein [Candidatus Aquilonibacter sp.]
MRRTFFLAAALFFSVSICLTVGGELAVAQGPAGNGASAAAQESSHSADSLNPVKWLKKDSKDSGDAAGNRSEEEEKLTPVLRAHGVLAADATASDACAPFTALDGCLAALHASHNLKMDFYCLRADVTGVNSGADLSGCRVASDGKAQSLNKAIHQLQPDANAKAAAKDAEQQASDDLKQIGG